MLSLIRAMPSLSFRPHGSSPDEKTASTHETGALGDSFILWLNYYPIQSFLCWPERLSYPLGWQKFPLHNEPHTHSDVQRNWLNKTQMFCLPSIDLIPTPPQPLRDYSSLWYENKQEWTGILPFHLSKGSDKERNYCSAVQNCPKCSQAFGMQLISEIGRPYSTDPELLFLMSSLQAQ